MSAPEETVVVNEKQRAYIYGADDVVILTDVETIYVAPSGNHYVKWHLPAHVYGVGAEGAVRSEGAVRLTIVAPGWRAIEIDPGEREDWTF